MGHAGGIHSRSENGNLVVGGSESFDTLKSLLRIIQGWCHTMYTEVRVFDKFGLAPLSRLGAVVGFDMTVDCHETQQGFSKLHAAVSPTFSELETNAIPVYMLLAEP